MTIEHYFADPRRRRSEALAFNADRLTARGSDARAIYAEAAALEEAVALEVPEDMPRVRSVLAISAVELWTRASRSGDVLRASNAFLAAGGLTPDGRKTLAAYAEDAQRLPVVLNVHVGTEQAFVDPAGRAKL